MSGIMIKETEAIYRKLPSGNSMWATRYGLPRVLYWSHWTTFMQLNYITQKRMNK